MARRRPVVASFLLLCCFGLAAAAPVLADEPPPTLSWPAKGRITQGYGCTGFNWEPRRGSCRHFHSGIDIANARGTPISSAAEGVITFVGWDPWDRGRRPAWMVIVKHSGGIRTLYAHMTARRMDGVSKGAAVRRGQVIGYMNMTGKATGVHLHWAAMDGSRFVSPARYLPRGSTSPGKSFPRRWSAHRCAA